MAVRHNGTASGSQCIHTALPEIFRKRPGSRNDELGRRRALDWWPNLMTTVQIVQQQCDALSGARDCVVPRIVPGNVPPGVMGVVSHRYVTMTD
jgi:hypothetical protein